MRALIVSICLLLAACATTPQAPEATGDSLDIIAADYVRMQLEMGEREEGYVDAYYGPAEWKTAAEAAPRTVDQLLQASASLTQRLNALEARGWSPDLVQRREYLLAHLRAAETRMRMAKGERLSFADEAEALFGIRPVLLPLSHYEPILARIDALEAGRPTPAAAKPTTAIPLDRLETVVHAAIAECRRRTMAHIDLPEHESFTLAIVNDKPWGAYNYYLGDAASKIEVNTDSPVTLSAAVDYGCHEGYPGHHVYNGLLEQTFVRGRGWVEMSIYPLYSPMSLIAEGSGNYGVELAFPGDENIRFQREVLAPLAGVDPAAVTEDKEMAALRDELRGAWYTIADAYLAGRIDREETITQFMKYRRMSRPAAEQSLRFTDAYRSYIINYGLGQDMVRAWVERQGPDHWAAMERLLSSQILPADID